jgi:hypothetical protein
MSIVGQIEKMTQQRVVKLFCDKLGYDYLGNWKDREGRNIEEKWLRAFLTNRERHDDALITRCCTSSMAGKRHRGPVLRQQPPSEHPAELDVVTKDRSTGLTIADDPGFFRYSLR